MCILIRSIARDGNFVEVSEFGVSGREIGNCCTVKYERNVKFSFFIKCIIEQKVPSFLLGVSGVDLLLFGTISRLMLDTRSRNDNAGLGGATGRGNVYIVTKKIIQN